MLPTLSPEVSPPRLGLLEEARISADMPCDRHPHHRAQRSNAPPCWWLAQRVGPLLVHASMGVGGVGGGDAGLVYIGVFTVTRTFIAAPPVRRWRFLESRSTGHDVDGAAAFGSLTLPSDQGRRSPRRARALDVELGSGLSSNIAS